jgi:hypothetical protein
MKMPFSPGKSRERLDMSLIRTGDAPSTEVTHA